MKKLLYLLLITFSIASCTGQQKKGIELIKPVAFEKEMISHKGQIIDVRTPKEFQSGYINGAVNMHIYDKNFSQRLDSLDKTKTVYVYCKAGGRSAEAVEILKLKGFAHVVELDGGMDAWNEAGKPVKK
ncbi:rhodanese-like domain-containing protein [Flavobacterium sp. Sd200]|uniref:rhodanese-like domain-containing protein n=1 Tax=Flavobacterium sp. Sd200 TaxID=2692211 RepID=UPI0013689A22|nr:rhodanese-like domain-containing protein [Flavobacterium sp. Sd200]MXN93149.1 rhodanese-like domain-containing protein [Flavobacterium sp. Sd200]